LIETLKSGGLSDSALEHTLGLLSSLAIDSVSSDQIVKEGGVGALIWSLEMSTSGLLFFVLNTFFIDL